MFYKKDLFEEINGIPISSLLKEFKTPNIIALEEKNLYINTETEEIGDVYKFLSAEGNLNQEQIMEYVKRKYGIDIKKEKEDIIDLSIFYKMNKAAMSFYQEQLVGEPLTYLKTRKVSNYNIEKFKLGYAGEFGDLLYQHLLERGYTKDEMLEGGLISISKTGKAYDRFWERVIYPIFDEDRKVVGFGGRTLRNDNAKYINSMETPVFDKRRTLYGLHLAKHTTKKYFIACEGYMDVIAFHQQGLNNAVASLGTALTREHIQKLKTFTNQIYLAYDSDLPGRTATAKAIDLIESEGMCAKVIDLNPWKDPDEFAKNEGRKALEERVESASEAKKWKIKASILTPGKENYIKNVIKILLAHEDAKGKENQYLQREG